MQSMWYLVHTAKADPDLENSFVWLMFQPWEFQKACSAIAKHMFHLRVDHDRPGVTFWPGEPGRRSCEIRGVEEIVEAHAVGQDPGDGTDWPLEVSLWNMLTSSYH